MWVGVHSFADCREHKHKVALHKYTLFTIYYSASFLPFAIFCSLRAKEDHDHQTYKYLSDKSFIYTQFSHLACSQCSLNSLSKSLQSGMMGREIEEAKPLLVQAIHLRLSAKADSRPIK